LRSGNRAEELVDTIEGTLAGADMLVANARTGRITSYETADAALFDETLAVNLRAPYLLARSSGSPVDRDG
jgi:3-oxoacyl-[acyl-carrier protein] reductase